MNTTNSLAVSTKKSYRYGIVSVNAPSKVLARASTRDDARAKKRVKNMVSKTSPYRIMDMTTMEFVR